MLIENYKDNQGNWKKSLCVKRKVSFTKCGSIWNHMAERCKINGLVQKTRPSYIGCSMSDSFKDFQFFVEWCQNQIGYGLENYHIDKDILIPENKLYAEDTCIFVPAALNTFFTDCNSARGVYPQGVTLPANRKRYLVQIRIDGKTKYIGYFNTIPEASKAYKEAKEAEARRWYQRLTAGEFIVDPRVIERMRVWTFKERLQ